MPRAWTDKDERKYEHIAQSAREDGKPPARAKEIAARTVNKQRREEGRTPSAKTQGTGNFNRSYEERSKQELVNLAKDRGVSAPTTKNKDELIRALRQH